MSLGLFNRDENFVHVGRIPLSDGETNTSVATDDHCVAAGNLDARSAIECAAHRSNPSDSSRKRTADLKEGSMNRRMLTVITVAVIYAEVLCISPEQRKMSALDATKPPNLLVYNCYLP